MATNNADLRWMLTEFSRDPDGNVYPVCKAYSMGCMCPNDPADPDAGEKALVLVKASPLQIEAAKADPRIVVCPFIYDPRPVPEEVITAYASKGATSGMSMGALLSVLGDTEPLYLNMSF